MPKKRFSAEQIVTLLRQIEVSMGQGNSTQIACREAGISEKNYARMLRVTTVRTRRSTIGSYAGAVLACSTRFLRSWRARPASLDG